MITVSTNAGAVAQRLGRMVNKLYDVLEAAAEETNKEIARDFQVITQTWQHKPAIKETVTRRGRDVVGEVSTDDPVFGYLEKGVRPRWIGPVRAKVLRFQTGFRAKSRPGLIGSNPGGSFGPFAFSKGHKWPGIKPRRWIPKIQERANKLAPKIYREHLRRLLG